MVVYTLAPCPAPVASSIACMILFAGLRQGKRLRQKLDEGIQSAHLEESLNETLSSGFGDILLLSQFKDSIKKYCVSEKQRFRYFKSDNDLLSGFHHLAFCLYCFVWF